MTIITTSHIHYAKNWARHIQMHVLNSRHVIWCLDRGGCVEQLKAAGFHAKYLSSIDNGWRSVKSWVGVAKFIGALVLLQKGEHVIVTDADFVVRKDVTELLNGRHDIEMQGGLVSDADLWKHFYDTKAYRHVLCIGFMSMLPTDVNVKF